MLGPSNLPIPFELLVTYHPQFALAVMEGVKVRPTNRALMAQFSNTAAGQYMDASFPTQMAQYSVFTKFAYTIDPSNAFGGSSQKGQSDYFTERVSGLTFTLQVRGGGPDEYTPVNSPIPLQMAPDVLSPAIGVWAMGNQQNVFGRFTVNSPPIGAQITVWATFGFLTLGPNGQLYLDMPTHEARRCLREKWGIGCLPIVGQGAQGAPPGAP